MRTIGMGAAPKSEEDKKLLSEIVELQAENAALKQEIEELKANKSSFSGRLLCLQFLNLLL